MVFFFWKIFLFWDLGLGEESGDPNFFFSETPNPERSGVESGTKAKIPEFLNLKKN